MLRSNRFRPLGLIATCALVTVFCVPGHGQDSPSLGDLARQAQKDKTTSKAPAKVITNDDMPSRSGGGSAFSGGQGKVVSPNSAGDTSQIVSPTEGLDRLQSMLTEIDSLDRTTLANKVLEGDTSNFPGRAKWEEELFAAKQTFVAQSRAVLQKARQIAASSEGLKDAQDPNDPRAKALSTKLQQLVQEAQQNSATFQAVIAEGHDLSSQASH